MACGLRRRGIYQCTVVNARNHNTNHNKGFDVDEGNDSTTSAQGLKHEAQWDIAEDQSGKYFIHLPHTFLE